MTQYGFHFDASRCTGCKTCVLACKDIKDLDVDHMFRRVYEFGDGGWQSDDQGCWTTDSFVYYVSSACNHCANPACTQVCPVQSMTKHDETGLVYNDPATCIGCGACVAACPYGAPSLDEERGISIKCDGCHGRVEQGGQPACSEACPQRALDFGDIDELRATYGELSAIAPLPDPSQTDPSVTITPCDAAVDWDGGVGEVMNDMELV
ncbi:MAG: DMSO/selenate family reductase complex B subunit [Coriobacteriales bacterium]|jgi:anaerobic dimethyl sulfoxide reductase subunit B (iron-sulfur subunit)